MRTARSDQIKFRRTLSPFSPLYLLLIWREMREGREEERADRYHTVVARSSPPRGNSPPPNGTFSQRLPPLPTPLCASSESALNPPVPPSAPQSRRHLLTALPMRPRLRRPALRPYHKSQPPHPRPSPSPPPHVQSGSFSSLGRERQGTSPGECERGVERCREGEEPTTSRCVLGSKSRRDKGAQARQATTQ